MPKAIVAAQNTYSGEKYISIARKYVEAILANTSKDKDNWATRFFAAEVYLDLYAKTKESSYLRTAYNIALDNVTFLLQEQRELNTTYLNPVKEETVPEPDYRFMSEKEKKEKKKEYEAERKRVKQYNKALKEKRKTELPEVYEPLALNCELVFTLADELKINDAEKKEVDMILQTASNGVFTVGPINDAFSFAKIGTSYTVALSKDGVIIPANVITEGSTVIVTITDNGATTAISDLTLSKVERKGGTCDTFYAHYTSKEMKNYSWTPDSKVSVEIVYGGVHDKSKVFRFSVDKYDKTWFGIKVEFKQE